jgi:RimJ/RimL family protein N-acetyltransferase|tara:strand:+ start:170 stop:637 length:468 start_codon:yes stop_codon:yes gene_type:complete
MEIINFKIRKSNNNDQKLIWKWRNDPESRLMFFNTSVVSWEEHLEWYNEIESDKNKLCLVAENNGQLLAVSHFHKAGTSASISVNTNPDFRGQGHGYHLIREFSNVARKILELKEINAVVKVNNTRSIKSFIKAGFKEIEKFDDGKRTKYKLSFS